MNKRVVPQQLLQWKERFEKIKIPSGIIFFILGIGSTIWFLIRVIPKPSRAYYPCMRTAAPFMSSFIIYLLTLGTGVFAFRKFREKLLQQKYKLAVLFFALSLVASVIYLIRDAQPAAAATPPDGANNPMGTAMGIMPGRVVWAWDSAATNAYCGDSIEKDIDGLYTLTYDSTWDFYYNPKNNDQSIIDNMVSESIKKLAGKPTEEEAWDAIFHYFNNLKHNEDSGYKTGQFIFIKVNGGSMSWAGKFQWGDFARATAEPNIVETTPFMMVAMIKSLVEKAGVPENKIVIGEPMRNLYKDVYEYIRKYYKNVNITGNDLQSMFSGMDLVSLGRMPVAEGTDTVYYSFKNSTLKDNLYDVYGYANYVINIAALKSHYCAGITLCAKNHFGSQTRQSGGKSSASHLHDSLLAPNNGTNPPSSSKVTNPGYKRYRPQVDLMGHPKLGGNTLLSIVDGLYSGQDGYFAPATKWETAPFNKNHPSSIFMSQDQVALESVCFDFLRTEYSYYNLSRKRFDCPNYPGVDDYLHQAADKANWPAGILYKPDKINEIGSLGTHEHWNNVTDKKYSRNLDPLTGKGIELVGVCKAVYALGENTETTTGNGSIEGIYPNPASDIVNITYSLTENASVAVEIYSMEGKKITTLKNQTETEGKHITTWNINQPSGIYICKLRVKNTSGLTESSAKIQVIK